MKKRTAYGGKSTEHILGAFFLSGSFFAIHKLQKIAGSMLSFTNRVQFLQAAAENTGQPAIDQLINRKIPV